MNKRYKEFALIILLSVMTLILSIRRFPRTTPDSDKYLILVEIFKGDLPVSDALSPFCYRPLMPFIVSLFPTDPLLTWAAISVILTTLMVPVIFLLIREFDIGPAGAFTGTGLTTVSFISILVGSWVITDIAAMLFLGLAFLAILRDTNKIIIISLLVIGTLFKELVIFGAAAWFIYSILKRDKQGIIFSIISGVTTVSIYISIQVFWSSVGVQIYLRKWLGMYNFIEQPNEVFYSFWLMLVFFTPVIILALIIGYKTKVPQFKETLIWLIACSAFLGYMCMGLFTAHFGARFIWPLYFGLAPLAGIFGDWFLLKLRKEREQ